MQFSKEQLWHRFQKYYTEFPSLGLALDLSRVNFPDDFFTRLEPRLQNAFAAMAELEKGALANPDEKRMVGHYWLRHSELAPTPALRQEIDDTLAAIKSFARDVHQGQVAGAAGPFKNMLWANRGPISSNHSSSTTPTLTAWIKCSVS
jgi:glucose-6-phosphate isomerase